MGEAGKEAWQGKSSTEVNLREILGAPDTSDSQANRVDRIHVGYVDERARSIDTPNTKENGGDCIQLVARTMI